MDGPSSINGAYPERIIEILIAMCVDLFGRTGAQDHTRTKGRKMRVLMSVTSWNAMELQTCLQEEGFLVTAAEDGSEVFESLTLLGRPIVILETGVPDVDWAESLKKLRGNHRNMSIFMMNTHKSVDDQIKAFELGADEVIDPDTDGKEVAARIRAVVVRRAGYSGPNVNIGPMRLRMLERSAYWGPQKIDLTPTQYNIFQTLCLAAPYAVSRHVIMAELYGLEEGCELLSVNAFISHVRAKLIAAGAPKSVIETVNGRGYRLSQLEPSENVLPVPADLPAQDLRVAA